MEEGEKLVLIMSSGKTVCTFGAGATIGSWCDGETGGGMVCVLLQEKQSGERSGGNLAAMSEGHGAVMPDGAFR